MAEGTSFSIDVGVQAAGVDSAATSLAALADRLTSAGAASIATSEAVKAGEASYRQAETSADRAAKAIEKIGLAADAQRGKMKIAMDAGDGAAFWRAAGVLEKLNVRQAEATVKAATATAAMNTEAASLDKLKLAAGAAADAEAKVSKSLNAAKTAAVATAKAQAAAAGSGKVNEMAEAFTKLGGPLGFLGGKALGAASGVNKLGASLGSMGPYVAAAIAIVAIATAAIAGTVAIVAWSVSLADAARTTALLSDGIAGSVAGGRELDATIHALGTQVPQTRDELLSMASSLAKTGLKGAELSAALETAAVKAAQLKYGPDFAKQTLSISSQVTRLKENIAGVFSGLHIDALLEAMSKLVELFDSTTVTGQAIKVVFESLFQPLIDGIVAFIPTAVSAFIQFEILVMKAMIAIKPFGSKILLAAEILGVLAAVVIGLAVVVGVLLVGAALAFVAVQAAMIAGVVWLIYQAGAASKAVLEFGASVAGGLTGPIKEAVAFLSSLSLVAIGTAMIDGLVVGIKSAGPRVIASITGIAGDAIKAAEKALGIGSPSKVFAEIGMNTAAGMAGGVDAASGDVQSSLETMVAPPETKGGTGEGSSSSGSGLNLSGATFNFYGVEGAEDAESRIGALLTRLLEGDVAQLGTAVPNA